VSGAGPEARALWAQVTLPDSPESGDSSEGRGSSLSSPASSPCSPVARRLLGRPFAEAGDGAAHASPGSPSVARAPPGSREGSAQPEMCAEIGVRAHGAAFARLSPERAAGTAPLLLPGGPGATSSDLFAQARLLGKADAEAAAQRARGTPPARPRAQQGAGGLASGEGAADDANQVRLLPPSYCCPYPCPYCTLKGGGLGRVSYPPPPRAPAGGGGARPGAPAAGRGARGRGGAGARGRVRRAEG